MDRSRFRYLKAFGLIVGAVTINRAIQYFWGVNTVTLVIVGIISIVTGYFFGGLIVEDKNNGR